MIELGVLAVGGLKFSMAQKKKFKKVPVGGSASLGRCQLGEVPVGGQNLTLGRTIFFQIL